MKWEPRISLGNVLTIVIMALGGAGVYTQMERSNARQDEQIIAIKDRLAMVERATFRQAGDVATKLDQINTRLSTIEGFLRRGTPSPP